MAAEAAHGSCLDLPPVRKSFAIRELPPYSRTGGEPVLRAVKRTLNTD